MGKGTVGRGKELGKGRERKGRGGAPHKCWNLGPQLPCYATDGHSYYGRRIGNRT